MNREEWIEEIRELDAMRFSHKSKKRAVAIERPGLTSSDDLKHRLPLTIEELVAGPTTGVFVGQFDSRITVPLDIDHADRAIRQDATDGNAAFQIFQSY